MSIAPLARKFRRLNFMCYHEYITLKASGQGNHRMSECCALNISGTGPAVKFHEKVMDTQGSALKAASVDTLQANLGYRCNLACRHCHVEGGPANLLTMDAETRAHVLRAIEHDAIKTLDLTGGAPELNPGFRDMVTAARKLNKHVIARTNLSVFYEPGQEGLAEFYTDNSVEVIASLPCYTEPNVDAIRGQGVFNKSIRALKELNAVGYGMSRGPELNLVYNPAGAFLPGDQKALSADYKRQLGQLGVMFNRLLALTNIPVGRFKKNLVATGRLAAYEGLLRNSFNSANLEGLMCRRLLSVSPEGRLHDCDFNQAAGFELAEGLPRSIADFDLRALEGRSISVAEHCYGCTAGQGST